jgi:chromosomal replication initiation ATPase DnaA
MIPKVLDEVIDTAAQYFGVTCEEMVGRSRKQPLVHFRQIAMSVAYLGPSNLPEIGRAFGRDHTTVLYAIENVIQRIDEGDVETYVAMRSIVALMTGDLALEAEKQMPVREAAE